MSSGSKRTPPHRIAAVLATMVAIAGPLHDVARAERAAPKSAAASSNTTIAPSRQRVTLTKLATAEQPLALAQRAGDDTIYLASKSGRISALQAGVINPYPVLDISARIDTTNERGLLGLAFAPGRRDVLYVDYTDKRGNVIVSELPFDGKVADPSNERVLLDIAKPFNEHNAGTLAFDSAGMLLIAIGDGGGSGDRFNNAQRTDTLLGKVLRIDPRPGPDKAYSVPIDNPFASAGGKRRAEILAFGLRNPWGISIDGPTGDLWIPDIGESDVEEINVLTRSAWGSNFGWRNREGDQPFRGGAKPKGAVDPVHAYPHRDARCAVAGGMVYRGTALKELNGTYLFGDVCSGRLMALRKVGPRWVAESLGARVPYLVGFGSVKGEPVALSLEGGIVRLDPAS